MISTTPAGLANYCGRLTQGVARCRRTTTISLCPGLLSVVALGPLRLEPRLGLFRQVGWDFGQDDPRVQRITANLLKRMIQGKP